MTSDEVRVPTTQVAIIIQKRERDLVLFPQADMKLNEFLHFITVFVRIWVNVRSAESEHSLETSNVFKFWPKLFNERTSHHHTVLAAR